jgi:hypothetical protein
MGVGISVPGLITDCAVSGMVPTQGKDVVFMETAMRLNDPKSHATVECIPVPPKVPAFCPAWPILCYKCLMQLSSFCSCWSKRAF